MSCSVSSFTTRWVLAKTMASVTSCKSMSRVKASNFQRRSTSKYTCSTVGTVRALVSMRTRTGWRV